MHQRPNIHSQGVLHYNLQKPSKQAPWYNYVTITDWGIACNLESQDFTLWHVFMFKNVQIVTPHYLVFNWCVLFLSREQINRVERKHANFSNGQSLPGTIRNTWEIFVACWVKIVTFNQLKLIFRWIIIQWKNNFGCSFTGLELPWTYNMH